MPEVSHLLRPKPTETTIDLGDGDTVTLVFDRNKVTPAWVAEAEKRDEARDTFSLPKAIAEVILSWDVTDEAQPFQPTADNIAIFSYPVQAELLQAIMRASVPGAAEGNASANTSSIADMDSRNVLANLPNGQLPSPSPVPLAAQ